ncbi:hypothetical protein BHE74_00019252 [Ensete ventricosum]|nr:hypothetical protein GW17_00022215 [Ensete ventricosum]RWW72908.1 hypothetical protein BHE74_00019252 [Ensete ventricosum]RZS08622.1 hypothetical protein BHM03_00039623 [Ensete ventricosum]
MWACRDLVEGDRELAGSSPEDDLEAHREFAGGCREVRQEGGTSVELSIPCSHGGRALVVKGAKEVENAEVNSKYQDKAERQRPRNIISQ